jgi:DNA polymerase III alpha subunit (gram-positive type)
LFVSNNKTFGNPVFVYIFQKQLEKKSCESSLRHIMGKTLELARKQGVLRSRNINSVFQQRMQETKNGGQIFSYFMVIDFEATCWARKSGAPPSEIIEFPAVILDGKTGQILPEHFHKYVQPMEEPSLSEFCTELTGICQKQVDNSAPLGSILMQFNTWIRTKWPNFVFNSIVSSFPPKNVKNHQFSID